MCCFKQTAQLVGPWTRRRTNARPPIRRPHAWHGPPPIAPPFPTATVPTPVVPSRVVQPARLPPATAPRLATQNNRMIKMLESFIQEREKLDASLKATLLELKVEHEKRNVEMQKIRERLLAYGAGNGNATDLQIRYLELWKQNAIVMTRPTQYVADKQKNSLKPEAKEKKVEKLSTHEAQKLRVEIKNEKKAKNEKLQLRFKKVEANQKMKGLKIMSNKRNKNGNGGRKGNRAY